MDKKYIQNLKIIEKAIHARKQAVYNVSPHSRIRTENPMFRTFVEKHLRVMDLDREQWIYMVVPAGTNMNVMTFVWGTQMVPEDFGEWYMEYRSISCVAQDNERMLSMFCQNDTHIHDRLFPQCEVDALEAVRSLVDGDVIENEMELHDVTFKRLLPMIADIVADGKDKALIV